MSNGEPCICEYVTLLQSFHRATLVHSSKLLIRHLFRGLFKNNTELSKELWQIKMKNYTPKITWRIIRKCLPYNYNSRKGYLCLNEKLERPLYERENLLNTKMRPISKRRRQNKFMLLCHDSKDWKWYNFQETIVL